VCDIAAGCDANFDFSDRDLDELARSVQREQCIDKRVR